MGACSQSVAEICCSTNKSITDVTSDKRVAGLTGKGLGGRSRELAHKGLETALEDLELFDHTESCCCLTLMITESQTQTQTQTNADASKYGAILTSILPFDQGSPSLFPVIEVDFFGS